MSKNEVTNTVLGLEEAFAKSIGVLKKAIKEHGKFELPKGEWEKIDEGEDSPFEVKIKEPREGFEGCATVCEVYLNKAGIPEFKDWGSGVCYTIFDMEETYWALEFCRRIWEADSGRR